MALIQCHECSGQVSDHARTCPHCGAPVIATIKRRQKAALVDLGVRAGFALIVIIIFSVMFDRMTQKTLAPLKEMQQQLQQPPTGAARPPMVVNFQPPPVQPPPEPVWVKKIRLQGVSGPPDHRLASINDKMFEKGDQIVLKVDGKSVKVSCLEVRESSASVSIEGIDGARELRLTGK